MSNWNTGVIEEFRANDGRVGGHFEGAPMILIHRIGAKSGIEQVSPLRLFPQEDGSMLVIASKVGTETFLVEAEVLPRAERDAILPVLVAEAPGFGLRRQDRAGHSRRAPSPRRLTR